MHRLFALIAFVLILFTTVPAHARISVTATSGGTFDVKSFPDDVYVVDLVATSTSADTVFTIVRSSEDDVISKLTIHSRRVAHSKEPNLGCHG